MECQPFDVCFVDSVFFGALHFVNIIWCSFRISKLLRREDNGNSNNEGTNSRSVLTFRVNYNEESKEEVDEEEEEERKRTLKDKRFKAWFIISIIASIVISSLQLGAFILSVLWTINEKKDIHPLEVVARAWSLFSWILSIVNLIYEEKKKYFDFSPIPYFWIIGFGCSLAKLFLNVLPSEENILKIVYYVEIGFYSILFLCAFIELIRIIPFSELGVSPSTIDYRYQYTPVRNQKGGEGNELEGDESDDDDDILLDDEEVEGREKNDETKSNEGDEPPKKKRKSTWQNIKRLSKLAKHEYFIFFVGFLMSIIAGITSQMANKMYAPIIDAASPEGGGKPEVISLSLKLLGVYIGLSLSIGFARYLFVVGGERYSARLRVMVLSSITRQEMNFFDKNKSGSLANRLSSDIIVLNESLTKSALAISNSITSIIIGFVLMFSSLWQLTLYDECFTSYSIYFCNAIIIEKLQVATLSAAAKAGDVVTEIFTLFRVVRAFDREKKECERYQSAVRALFKISKKKGLVEGVFESILYFLYYSPLVLAVLFGCFFIIDGKFTIGELFTFFLISLEQIWSSILLTQVISEVGKISGSSSKILYLLNRRPKIDNEFGERPKEIKGDIEFRDISFCYPSRPEKMVLQNFSLTIKSGEKVAIVGPSGSGKSTIVNLLERFYDCSSGEIFLDGKPLNSLSPSWVRKSIGIVSQDPALFALSITENIIYGVSINDLIDQNLISESPIQAESTIESAIQSAAITANAHSFIESLPKKYQTQVGERGHALSGGQKQRIAIARAVLKNPKILLLDEATSALDSSSEREVQDALDKIMEGRTCIVVAHRLSTIRNADKIVVMKDGKVEEMGSHTELLELNGLYKDLFEKQLNDS